MLYLRSVLESSLILNGIGLLLPSSMPCSSCRMGLGTAYMRGSHRFTSRLTLSHSIMSCAVCSTSPSCASRADPSVALALTHLVAAAITARSFPSVNWIQRMSLTNSLS
nr:hypothetical protein [Trichoderma harzianum]